MRVTTLAVHDHSVEGVDLKSFKLHAIELSHVIDGLAKVKVKGLVGVLGADVLHRSRAVIDYSRGMILLSQQRSRR